MMNFIHLPYDGRFAAYRFSGEHVLTFPTKKEAQVFAKSIGWAQNTVAKLGNRFWRGWGIRCIMRDAFVAKCPVLLLFELRPYGASPQPYPYQTQFPKNP